MLPDSIPHFSVGPFCGLAANAILVILCLIVSVLYPHYRPLRSLFLFYLFIALAFLGWVVYGLQKSPESILLGNRMLYASISFLPAVWFWFYLSLFNGKPSWLTWIVTGISLILAALALLGEGPLLFGLPLEKDPIALDIMRPQSKLLKPVIQSFCLMTCIFYFLLIILKLWRFKGRRPVYLLPVGIGLLVWFLGGLHDGLRVAGVAVLYKDHLLWFTSFWLSIFLTIAIAVHFRSLEHSVREEVERLNKIRSKTLDHLSHEIRTPLAVIQGNIRILKHKLLTPLSFSEGGKFFESLEKQLNRLLEIQQETDKIIRFYQESDRIYPQDESGPHSPTFQPVFLYSFTEKTLEKAKQAASHRDIRFNLEGVKDHYTVADPKILQDILEGLLKNAIENTPDEGVIQILLEQKGQRLLLKVQDFGVGITEENQKYIFDGLFHTQERDLYASKKPYDFNAGGKGLDLLLMKVYGQRLGFVLSMESRRCIHLTTDKDLCPGRISACPRCERPEDCFSSGESTFCVSFPIGERKEFKRIYLRRFMRRFLQKMTI